MVTKKFCCTKSQFFKYWNIFGCVLGATIITMLGTAAIMSAQSRKPQNLPVKGILKVGAEEIQLEYAETLEQKKLGLSYRTTLPANRGMLFINEAPTEVYLWTYGMNQSIDILFLDSSNKIVKIVDNAVPCLIKKFCTVYSETASKVLEIPADLNYSTFKVGEKLNIYNIQLAN